MTCRVVIFAAAAIAAFGLTARAETFFIKGREKPVTGNVVSEDAKVVKISVVVPKKKDEDIPATDIIDIHYEGIAPAALGLKGGAYREAKDAEKEADDGPSPAARKKALDLALAKYQETIAKMQKSATKTGGYLARHLEYKVAMLTLRKASADGQPTDSAAVRLEAFKKNHVNSWQINIVMPTLAQLHLDAKDYKSASATYQEMAEMEIFPPDVRRDAELMVVQVSVRAGNIAEANKKLDALEKKASANPVFASRVKMARAEVLVGQNKIADALPILQQVVKENNDKQIKAIAHNTLGEIYFKAEKYDDAKWEFLFVDAVFNHDKHQHAKALYFLTLTFEKLGDAPRAQECRETLLNGTQFVGTEHRRLMEMKTK